MSSTGRATKVYGKRYPMWLRPLSGFADLQRDHFDTIQRVFGDRRLFSKSIATRAKERQALGLRPPWGGGLGSSI